ncbi:MAG TPA: hypothetical protein VIB82_10855 [Caulobacteraceae bacterium]|jgi:hypothetical protein
MAKPETCVHIGDAMSLSASLTGVWDGQFNYPRLLPPNSFTAVILEFGGAISGTVHEVADTGRSKGVTVTAAITGTRSGQNVTFTKVYDPEGKRHRHPVHYEGAVNADATQITGTWTIPGNWTGNFIMTRSPGGEETVAAEREAFEPAL